ncbi:hypothetical protein E2562_005913 [Oryza meyeriana var. granulata]|uniref:Uncharacterized protein n=1 Tax=Oryza meyeriana var. granulata TaxID=110450 RepID=A0A6G1DUW1_9ORYZ|nr:hypothetical protein E2562_005913 [Oryza meyeriana var. granulata]
MDSEGSLPLWVVLDSHVLVRDEIGVEAGRSEWAMLRCDKRKSNGCGSDGDLVVDGLTLFALLADPPGLSALYLHRSDDVAKAKGP